jgi:hypothetical protein
MRAVASHVRLFTTAGDESRFDDELKRRMYPSQRVWWWGMFGPPWEKRAAYLLGL